MQIVIYFDLQINQCIKAIELKQPKNTSVEGEQFSHGTSSKSLQGHINPECNQLLYSDNKK